MKNISYSPTRFKGTAPALFIWKQVHCFSECVVCDGGKKNKKWGYAECKCGEFPNQSLPVIFVFLKMWPEHFLRQNRAFSLFFGEMFLFLLWYLPLVEHTHNSHSDFAPASAVCPFMHSFLALLSSERFIERAKLLQGPYTHLHTILPSFVVPQTSEGTTFCLQGYCGLGSVTHKTFLPCPRWSVCAGRSKLGSYRASTKSTLEQLNTWPLLLALSQNPVDIRGWSAMSESTV